MKMTMMVTMTVTMSIAITTTMIVNVLRTLAIIGQSSTRVKCLEGGEWRVEGESGETGHYF